MLTGMTGVGKVGRARPISVDWALCRRTYHLPGPRQAMGIWPIQNNQPVNDPAHGPRKGPEIPAPLFLPVHDGGNTNGK